MSYYIGMEDVIANAFIESLPNRSACQEAAVFSTRGCHLRFDNTEHRGLL